MNKYTSIKLLFITLLFNHAVNGQQDFYNVLKYGAKRDSSELATKAIAKAILEKLI